MKKGSPKAYNFITTVSQPGYLVAAKGKRGSSFMNLQAWRFFKNLDDGDKVSWKRNPGKYITSSKASVVRLRCLRLNQAFS
jgi:hypothetical protein